MTTFCDEKCWNAKGENCDCECNATNHGAVPGGRALTPIDRTKNRLPVSVMTNAELNKEMKALDRQRSRLTDAFIASGRGHERPSDRRGKTDALSVEAESIEDRRTSLSIEMTSRAGPPNSVSEYRFEMPKGYPNSKKQKSDRALYDHLAKPSTQELMINGPAQRAERSREDRLFPKTFDSTRPEGGDAESPFAVGPDGHFERIERPDGEYAIFNERAYHYSGTADRNPDAIAKRNAKHGNDVILEDIGGGTYRVFTAPKHTRKSAMDDPELVALANTQLDRQKNRSKREPKYLEEDRYYVKTTEGYVRFSPFGSLSFHAKKEDASAFFSPEQAEKADYTHLVGDKKYRGKVVAKKVPLTVYKSETSTYEKIPNPDYRGKPKRARDRTKYDFTDRGVKRSRSEYGLTATASENATYNWAHREGARWPGSSLQGHRVRAVFEKNGDLVDLDIDGGKTDVDSIDGTELNAFLDDLRGPRN